MSEVDEILAELDEDQSQHQDVIEAAEAQADAEDDKVERTLRKKYEEISGKMDQLEMSTMRKEFEADADPYEKELFDGLKGGLKTVEDTKLAIEKVKQFAANLRDKAQKLEQTAAEEAQEKASKAWGMTAPGRSQRPQNDEEKELLDRIGKGDIDALVTSLYPPGSYPGMR